MSVTKSPRAIFYSVLIMLLATYTCVWLINNCQLWLLADNHLDPVSTDLAKGPSTKPEVVSADVARDAVTSLEVPTEGCEIEVKDTLMDLPLPNAEILRLGTNEVLDVVGTHGRKQTSAEAAKSLLTEGGERLEVRVSIDGFADTEKAVAFSSPETSRSRVVVATGILACLKISFVDVPIESEEVNIRVRPLPNLDVLYGFEDAVRTFLTRARRLNPDVYLGQLQNRGVLNSIPEVNRVVMSSGDVLVSIPYSGELLLECYAKGKRPWIGTVDVLQGATSTVDVTLQGLVSICGQVLGPDSQPLPGVRVQVCGVSDYSCEEVIPRASHEPGNPACIELLEETTELRSVIMQVWVETDSTGNYCALLPHSGSVCGWVIDRDFGRGLASKDSGGRYQSVDHLDIHLSGIPLESALVGMFGADGAPLANRKFQFIESPPTIYQQQLPAAISDEKGYCDLWFLERGKRYFVAGSGSPDERAFEGGGIWVFK